MPKRHGKLYAGVKLADLCRGQVNKIRVTAMAMTMRLMEMQETEDGSKTDNPF